MGNQPKIGNDRGCTRLIPNSVISQLPIFLLLISLLVIIYQDYKERAVHLLSFTLLLGSILWIKRLEFDLFQLGLSFCFLLINLMVVFIYLRLRSRIDKPSQIWQYLGVGDVVFWLLIAFIMPFPTFLIFFFTGLFFSSLVALLFLKPNQSVPLAGLQALWLFCWIVIDMIFIRKDLILTDWLFLNFAF